MDRRSAYRSKSTSKFDRGARQLRADDKRKEDRAIIIILRRGPSDANETLIRAVAQRQKDRPAATGGTGKLNSKCININVFEKQRTSVVLNPVWRGSVYVQSGKT